MLYKDILIAHRQLTRESKNRELKIDEEIALLGSFAGQSTIVLEVWQSSNRFTVLVHLSVIRLLASCS